jgi:hypothetical protein
MATSYLNVQAVKLSIQDLIFVLNTVKAKNLNVISIVAIVGNV